MAEFDALATTRREEAMGWCIMEISTKSPAPSPKNARPPRSRAADPNIHGDASEKHETELSSERRNAIEPGSSVWSTWSSHHRGAAMSDITNIYDAKTNLSKLLDRAAAGEEIIMAKAGKPKAKLVPYRPAQKRGRFGAEPPRNHLYCRGFRRAPTAGAAELFRVGSAGRIRWRSNPCRRSTRYHPDIDLFR